MNDLGDLRGVPYNAGNILTSWGRVDFSERALLSGVSYCVVHFLNLVFFSIVFFVSLFIRTDVLPFLSLSIRVRVSLLCMLHLPPHSPALVRLQWPAVTPLSGQDSTVNNVRPAQNFDQTARCPIASVNSLPNICHSHTITGECYTFFTSSHATNWGTTSWMSSVALTVFSDWPRPLHSHNCNWQFYCHCGLNKVWGW